MSRYKLKELIEIAKTMTREEFLDKYTKAYGRDCWKEAICDIRFKDDIDRLESITLLKEIPEPPKEYTLYEVLNSFPEETEFIKVSNSINPLKYKVLDGNLYFYNYVNKNWERTISNLKTILEMKFEKVEEPKKLKPMTFEEAVKTGNKIKYNYDGYTLDKFHNIQNIFKHLVSPMYGSKTVSDIILKGTWFAEGVYE